MEIGQRAREGEISHWGRLASTTHDGEREKGEIVEIIEEGRAASKSPH